MIEKIERMIMLLDFYGQLLTKKQQEVMSLHYEQDLSFTEIAEQLNISRQAVYDLLRRAAALLEEYEERLGLVERFSWTRRELLEVQKLLNSNKELDRQEITRAVEIIRQALELF